MFTSFPRFPAGGPRTDDDSLILFGTYTCEHRSQHATGKIEGRSLAFMHCTYADHILLFFTDVSVFIL